MRSRIHRQLLPLLRNAIVSGELAPDERIDEHELCRTLGISRTPLRETLRTLEMEGLIRLEPFVGAIVSRIDPPDLQDRFEILASLESSAAASVTAAYQPTTLQRILAIQEDMTRAAASGSVADYYEANDQFHRAIVEEAGNDSLRRLHESIMWHVVRARRRMYATQPLQLDAASSHAGIIQALLDRNPEAALLAMREHLLEVSRFVAERLAAGSSGDSIYNAPDAPGSHGYV